MAEFATQPNPITSSCHRQTGYRSRLTLDKQPSIPWDATPSLPTSIPYRSHATNVAAGFMNPDGVFITNLGQQLINVEITNIGSRASRCTWRESLTQISPPSFVLLHLRMDKLYLFKYVFVVMRLQAKQSFHSSFSNSVFQ